MKPNSRFVALAVVALVAGACGGAEPVPTFDIESVVIGIAVDQDQIVYVSDNRGLYRVNDASELERLATADDAEGGIADLAVSSTGDLFAYVFGEEQSSIRRWSDDEFEVVVTGGYVGLLDEQIGDVSHPLMGFDVNERDELVIAGGSAHVVWRAVDGELEILAGSGSGDIAVPGGSIPYPFDVVSLPDGAIAVAHLSEMSPEASVIVSHFDASGFMTLVFDGRESGVPAPAMLTGFNRPGSTLAADGETVYLATDDGVWEIGAGAPKLMGGGQTLGGLTSEPQPLEEFKTIGPGVAVGILDAGSVLIGYQDSESGYGLARVRSDEIARFVD